MQLQEIMTRDVEFVSPDTPLNDVAQKMKEEDTGSIPVCDGDKIRGMITDRDIVIRALAEGKDPSSLKASDVMSKRIFFCMEDDDVRDAASLMERKKIRRLLVLNRQKRVVGLLSLGDLAMHAGRVDLAGKTLKGISGPSSPQSYFKELKKGPSRENMTPILAGVGVLGGLAALSYFLYFREQGVPEQFKDFVANARKRIA